MRTNGASWVVPLSIALVVVVGGVAVLTLGMATQATPVPPSSGLSAFDSSSTPIRFSLNLPSVGGVAIGLGFTTAVGMSGGTTSPGANITATASLSAPAQANINISYLGAPISLPIAPLGSAYDVPLPGLSYSYLGIAQLGLFLNFTGVIVGTPVVSSGPATTPGVALTWNASRTQDVNLAVSSTAADGASVVWTLSGIEYGLSMGIAAIGTVLGHGVSVPLLSFGNVGLFPGNPSSASASYSVPGSSGGGGGGGGGWNLGPNLPALSEEELLIGLILLVVIVAGVVLAVRHRRGPSP